MTIIKLNNIGKKLNGVTYYTNLSNAIISCNFYLNEQKIEI